jgi:hypothetical protein
MEIDQERVRLVLEEQFRDAISRRDLASFRFTEVSRDIPSGLPYPDGTQRIYNAGREYSAAVKNLSRALLRLTDFRERGTVPEDLRPLG